MLKSLKVKGVVEVDKSKDDRVIESKIAAALRIVPTTVSRLQTKALTESNFLKAQFHW